MSCRNDLNFRLSLCLLCSSIIVIATLEANCSKKKHVLLFYSYLTDGGLGLYTRRMNRLPDGMAVVRETLHRNTSSGQGDADR